MNGLVLFKKYIQSLDTLELSVFLAFSFLITIGEVCMFKSKMSLLGVNNVIKWELPLFYPKLFLIIISYSTLCYYIYFLLF